MKQNTSNRRPALLVLTIITLGTCAVLAQPPESSPAGVDIEKSDPFRKSTAAADKNSGQSPSAESLEAQARVLFARGETEKAIALQKDAVKKAQEALDKATENLARYEGKPANGIDQKLKGIIIRSLDVEDTSLQDVMDFLRVRAKELDAVETDPSQKGVNFVVQAKDAENRMVPELRLSNMPLGEILKLVCEATGTQFRIEGRAVIIEDRAK